MVGYTTVEATVGDKIMPGVLDHYLRSRGKGRCCPSLRIVGGNRDGFVAVGAEIFMRLPLSQCLTVKDAAKERRKR